MERDEEMKRKDNENNTYTHTYIYIYQMNGASRCAAQINLEHHDTHRSFIPVSRMVRKLYTATSTDASKRTLAIEIWMYNLLSLCAFYPFSLHHEHFTPRVWHPSHTQAQASALRRIHPRLFHLSLFYLEKDLFLLLDRLSERPFALFYKPHHIELPPETRWPHHLLLPMAASQGTDPVKGASPLQHPHRVETDADSISLLGTGVTTFGLDITNATPHPDARAKSSSRSPAPGRHLSLVASAAPYQQPPRLPARTELEPPCRGGALGEPSLPQDEENEVCRVFQDTAPALTGPPAPFADPRWENEEGEGNRASPLPATPLGMKRLAPPWGAAAVGTAKCRRQERGASPHSSWRPAQPWASTISRTPPPTPVGSPVQAAQCIPLTPQSRPETQEDEAGRHRSGPLSLYALCHAVPYPAEATPASPRTHKGMRKQEGDEELEDVSPISTLPMLPAAEQVVLYTPASQMDQLAAALAVPESATLSHEDMCLGVWEDEGGRPASDPADAFFSPALTGLGFAETWWAYA
eukprot:gene4642-3345_t